MTEEEYNCWAENRTMLRSKYLITFVVGAMIVLQCGCGESRIDYGRYRSVFSTDDPPGSSFLSGIEEDGGATMLFTFSMSEKEYNGFAARLVPRGYSAREPLDGQFGSWSAFNDPGKPVFGQSKPTSFGTTYFYFEPDRNRLTAIARFTAGR